MVITLVALCNKKAVALCNNRPSHFVITLVALCNKLEIDGRRTSNPSNKRHQNDNNNGKCSITSTSGFKIFLGKYNSLYADDLDREKAATPMTGRVV